VLLPKPRLTRKGKDKQEQRRSSVVPSFLPPVVLDHSKVIFFFPSPPFFPFSLLILHHPDDRLLHLLPHRRSLTKRKWHRTKWFKSLASCQRSQRYPHHTKETDGLRRFCQSSQPSPPQERPKRLPIHRNGRRYVTQSSPSASSLTPDPRLGESGLGKSTLVNTLFNTTLYPPKEPIAPHADRPQTVAIQSISAGNHPPFCSYPSRPALNSLFFFLLA
jgi:hypothetical protein